MTTFERITVKQKKFTSKNNENWPKSRLIYHQNQR